ncbi:hypothetical protein LCGC14_0754260 [marine sediment metagenome]|uniref:Uncharacterized protein n=1 Tax=marine sediment metagenome TaxID=412755 RepID=A0A0F9SN74_9ZZZZ
MSTKKPRPECTTPNCSRLQSGRGRDKCSTCYGAFARAVKRKQTTWDELEQKGLIGLAKFKAGPACQQLAEVLGVGTGKLGRPRKPTSSK